MQRIASCQCGGFRVTVQGDPVISNICHCTACQRRTGAPFAANAYFTKDNVKLDGPFKTWTRGSDSGRTLTVHFCPTCGSNVCWTLELRPDFYGVAPGAFADPTFPPPDMSIWEETKFAWVPDVPGIQHFPQARVVTTS